MKDVIKARIVELLELMEKADPINKEIMSRTLLNLMSALHGLKKEAKSEV